MVESDFFKFSSITLKIKIENHFTKLEETTFFNFQHHSSFYRITPQNHYSLKKYLVELLLDLVENIISGSSAKCILI